MIPAEAPPIREALFLAQDYLDSEYYRDLKPGTNQPYHAVDCSTGKTFHCGYDEQGAEGEPLLAMADGTLYFINKGPSYGVQSIVVPSGTDYAWFYAHQNRRTASDGQSVRAGQQIGVMGTTGGVQRHLHLSALEPRTRDCWFNAGPVLRRLKQSLLHPPVQEEDMVYFRKTTVSTVYVYLGTHISAVSDADWKAIVGALGRTPPVKTLPDTHYWFKKTQL